MILSYMGLKARALLAPWRFGGKGQFMPKATFWPKPSNLFFSAENQQTSRLQQYYSFSRL